MHTARKGFQSVSRSQQQDGVSSGGCDGCYWSLTVQNRAQKCGKNDARTNSLTLAPLEHVRAPKQKAHAVQLTWRVPGQCCIVAHSCRSVKLHHAATVWRARGDAGCERGLGD
jgi:hypothetical protein